MLALSLLYSSKQQSTWTWIFFNLVTYKTRILPLWQLRSIKEVYSVQVFFHLCVPQAGLFRPLPGVCDHCNAFHNPAAFTTVPDAVDNRSKGLPHPRFVPASFFSCPPLSALGAHDGAVFPDAPSGSSCWRRNAWCLSNTVCTSLCCRLRTAWNISTQNF